VYTVSRSLSVVVVLTSCDHWRNHIVPTAALHDMHGRGPPRGPSLAWTTHVHCTCGWSTPVGQWSRRAWEQWYHLSLCRLQMWAAWGGVVTGHRWTASRWCSSLLQWIALHPYCIVLYCIAVCTQIDYWHWLILICDIEYDFVFCICLLYSATRPMTASVTNKFTDTVIS